MVSEQLIATVIGAAAGAFAAAYFGFRYGWFSLKRERAFDRRLEWYEKATARLVDAGNRINWAQAAVLIGASDSQRKKAWSDVHQALVDLRGFELEAEMYASNDAYEAVREAMRDVSHVAGAAYRMAENASDDSPERLYEICQKLLYHAASRLAADVRDHLELEPISREWRLYDRELRELQEELTHFEEERVPAKDG